MAASSSSIMTEALRQSRCHMKKCFKKYVEKGKRMMKLHHLMQEMETVIEDKDEKAQLSDGLLGSILCKTQEAVVVPPYVAFAVRPSPGFCEFVKVNSNDLSVDGITTKDYLKFKEMIVDETWANDENASEIDFGAMDFNLLTMSLFSSIGNGVNFTSKFIASKIYAQFDGQQRLVDYLLSLTHKGEKLMINDTLNTVSNLQAALIVAHASLSSLPNDTPYQSFQLR